MPTTPTHIRKAGLRDATRKVELEILPVDIKGAKPKDPTACAAARALKRQLGVKEVAVMRRTTYINHGEPTKPNWTRYQTPESLTREIVAIDRGGRFEGGTYRLRPFSPSARLGAHQWRSRGREDGSRKPKPYHVTTNIRET